MERFHPERFVSGIRSLNRDLAHGIIDKKELYSHNQTRADEEQEALRTKMKERNLRYVEQRRKKQEQSLRIDTSDDSTLHFIKESNLTTPSGYRNQKDSRQSNRSNLNTTKLIPLSPNFLSTSKKSRYAPDNTNNSLETNDQTVSTRGTKENFHLSSPKKPEIDLGQITRSSTQNTRELHELNLPSPSMGSSTRSPFVSDLRNTRRNGLPFQTVFARDKSATGSNLDAKSMKKFLSARRIVDLVNSGSRDLTITSQRSDFLSEEKLNITKQYIQDYYRNTIQMLGTAHDALVSAIQVRKDKIQLDRCLNEVLNCAQKSHNIEFYISALKLQAKVLMRYKDLYRSIGNFRTIKRIADNNIDLQSEDPKAIHNFLLHKLSSYKNLGKCFQEIQNYKKAMFYCVKMLQTAWLLKDQHNELLAYDMIGIQYYYQGEIENANYYHQKLMNGDVEKVGSELRELGIEKLKSNITYKNQNKNKFKFKNVKSVEEELTSTSNPASEDEFELTEPFNLRYKPEMGKKNTHLFKLASRNGLIPLLLEQKRNQNTSSFRKVPGRRRGIGHKSMNETTMVFESIKSPPKPMIWLSHLSPNRFLKNFHTSDTKDIVNAYVNTESLYGNGTRSIVLDRRSLDEIRHKLETFRNNLLLAKIEVEKIIEAKIEYEASQKISPANSKGALFDKGSRSTLK